MNIGAAMVYVIARLEVTYAILTRRVASDKQCADMLNPSLIPSVALGDCSDRVIADIDQDGFIFPVDERDTKLFNIKATRNPRRHHRVQLVLRERVVYVRKSVIRKRRPETLGRVLDFLQWEFYIEAAALLRLRRLACVPTVRRIDCRDGIIEMDYIWGRDLRQILANGSDEIAYDEISRSFSALVMSRDQEETSGQVAEILINVIRRGVIPRELHDGVPERIRLWGIDCPEMKQAFGTRAKQFTGDWRSARPSHCESWTPTGTDEL